MVATGLVHLFLGLPTVILTAALPPQPSAKGDARTARALLPSTTTRHVSKDEQEAHR
jgi:hypothetical protein